MKKKIIAISGSTRKQSSNLNLIKAIAGLYKNDVEVNIYAEIADLPQFNPDLDTENAPLKISEFRQKLKAADGILICTPEYAMGVPGALKNAIDWTVSSAEFSHKPVALITASSIGEKAHASLIETLKIIESNMTDETQLLISFVKTKINNEGVITDVDTLQQINKLMIAFIALIK